MPAVPGRAVVAVKTPDEMNTYHREQFDAFSTARAFWTALAPEQRKLLLERARPYLELRRSVDRFQAKTFAETCTANCFRNRLSACCSKEGIVTFFGDVLLNVFVSQQGEIKALLQRLQRENSGFKCVYLGRGGCTWRLKPSVCAMFLCDAALAGAASAGAQVAERWADLRKEEKRFRWPDNPRKAVLFDWLETICMDAGYDSPLMYMHKSPGLLRVKKKALDGERRQR
jgi:hypothetical protein